MLIWENIKLAFASLLANKMRALLTMLGIIIGIGSVIAIMTISSSLTNAVSSSFQEMGANNVTVGLKERSEDNTSSRSGLNFGSYGKNASLEEKDLITDEMISKLKSQMKTKVKSVAINESIGNGTIKDGSDYANITLEGINAGFFSSTQIKLLAGRHIKASDLSGTKNVIMVSDKVVENMFEGDTKKALGEKININMNEEYYSYYIVGVYEYEETGFNSSTDEDITTSAYIPLTTAKKQARSEEGYSLFTVVSTNAVTDVSAFADEIEAFFLPYYMENQDYQITTTTMESMTESMNEMIQTVSIAIAFIAGISLLVGGIGVMNIMLVSITERTREIGTRKALGAKNSFIKLQFITESVILCLVGGIFGIILGFTLGAVAASFLGYTAAVPVTAILTAVGFSMAIGIFFGYYPANKAAKLNPIDALRYE